MKCISQLHTEREVQLVRGRRRARRPLQQRAARWDCASASRHLRLSRRRRSYGPRSSSGRAWIHAASSSTYTRTRAGALALAPARLMCPESGGSGPTTYAAAARVAPASDKEFALTSIIHVFRNLKAQILATWSSTCLSYLALRSTLFPILSYCTQESEIL